MCAVSNGLFAITFGELNSAKPPQFVHFVLPLICLYWVNVETSNLVHKLIIADNKPSMKGVWLRHVPLIMFLS